MEKKYRFRYAPSPTGYLHVGNARTALFNFLLAKHFNGSFIIRIENTDIARNNPVFIDKQYEMLSWLNITFDESSINEGAFGPYEQLKRLKIYQKYVQILLDQKKAYYCFCTREEIKAQKEILLLKNQRNFKYDQRCLKLDSNLVLKYKKTKPFVIRFKVNNDKNQYQFNDLIRGEVKFNSNDVGDFIILKNNSIPTYNFAVVIDDHLMEISHVLRGEEHISNTFSQILLYEALNFEIPFFGHFSIIVNQERKKLSKRDKNNVSNLHIFKQKGYLPQAVLNFLALIGFSPKTKNDQEIFSLQELIKIINFDHFNKAPGMFDIKKLNWINKIYLKKLDSNSLYQFLIPFLKSKYDISEYSKFEIETIFLLFQEELEFGEQIIKLTKLFFVFDDLEIKNIEFFKNQNFSVLLIKKFLIEIKKIDQFSQSNLSKLLKNLRGEFKLNIKNLYLPLRIATTLSTHGPSLIQTWLLLKKKRLIANLNLFLKNY